MIIDNMTLIKSINKKLYSQVYISKIKEMNEFCAVKQLNRYYYGETREIKRIIYQIKALYDINHINILNYFGVKSTKKIIILQWNIVMEEHLLNVLKNI